MIVLSTVRRMVRKALPFYLFTFFPLYFFSSCGVDSDRFRLEGRLRNINQGEFWLYSIDGGITGIDTIPVREGRFSYETELRTPSTFILIFPNYSEQPVFAEPGKKVTIKGDATRLREMTIEGTKANKSMTQLRMELSRLMPPEIPNAVAAFITEQPQSPVSIYLLQRYFMNNPDADFQKGYELATLMVKELPDNVRLATWKKQLETMKNGQVKHRLPSFSAVDINGRSVSNDQLKSRVNVITLWASWSFQSTDMQQRLKRSKQRYGNDLAVVSICLDANAKDCRQRITRDSLRWQTICDGRMWQSPLIAKLGLSDVPGNLVIDDKGIIIDSNLKPEKLEEKINQLLK